MWGESFGVDREVGARVDRNVMGSFGSGPESGVYKLQDMCEKCVCGGLSKLKRKIKKKGHDDKLNIFDAMLLFQIFYFFAKKVDGAKHSFTPIFKMGHVPTAP